jgi:hypothetical protein
MATLALREMRVAAVAGGALFTLARANRKRWHDLALVANVAKYSFMIFLIDRLPNSVRRSILSKEYEGEMLEKRLTQRIFKGMSTVRALWRMSSVNLRPRVRVGDAAPPTPVLLEGREVCLTSLARGKRPLLLNFGSCT